MAITLCALLWAVDGRADDLTAYETDVLALLARHGGRVVSRVRATQDDDGPTEVQVLELPGEDALAAFIADPDRVAMSDRRDACIARTQLQRVTPLPT